MKRMASLLLVAAVVAFSVTGGPAVLPRAHADTAQQWIQLSPTGGPPPTKFFGASAVYDPSTNRLILFGGNNGVGTTNDVWVLTNANGLDGTPAWTQLSPTGAPPQARDNHAAVYDPSTNRMIVFGGCAGGCLPALNDVWVLTNANGLGGTPAWTQLLPSGSPPAPRIAMASAYDPASNKLILFGGQNGGGFGGATFSEVWVLTNANGLGGTPVWTNVLFAGGPPPGQYRLSYAFDNANNRLIVAGGNANSTGLPTNAVWVLSDANDTGSTPTWTNVIAENPAGPPPDFEKRPAAFDPATGRMIIVGDARDGTANLDAWLVNNANGISSPSSWTRLLPTGGPPPGSSSSDATLAAYDPSSNRLIGFYVVTQSSISTNQIWVLTNANGVSPFSAFSAKVDITLARSSFEVNNNFTLGAGGSIDPLTQKVTFKLGAFSTTIPAGSFMQGPHGQFLFSGFIDGVAIEVNLTPLGGGSYAFRIEGVGASNLPTSNPVRVSLTIGGNTGSTSVNAEFQ